MDESQASDFVTIADWCSEFGGAILGDPKMLHYHTKPLQRQLIEAGAMAKVGRLVFLHKSRFWPEYQRIQLLNLEVA